MNKEERLKKFIEEYPHSTAANTMNRIKQKEEQRFLRTKKRMEKLSMIFELRDKHHMTLKEIGKKLGFSKQNISQFIKYYEK